MFALVVHLRIMLARTLTPKLDLQCLCMPDPVLTRNLDLNHVFFFFFPPPFANACRDTHPEIGSHQFAF